MNVLYLILLIIAAVLLAMAALNHQVRRYNLIAAGLFFWVLVPLIQSALALGGR